MFVSSRLARNHLQTAYSLRQLEELLTFPMSGNNTFERSDFVDLRFSFWSSKGACHSPMVFLWKKIIAKHETNVFVFSFQRVCLYPTFHCRKIKEQIAQRRNLLDINLSFGSIVFMKPVSIIASDIAKFREKKWIFSKVANFLTWALLLFSFGSLHKFSCKFLN